jgi:hypothetical protein
MVAPMTRRQRCNSVTMCNGSKSHKPFSINNCNGVTGVPHLSWLPPMTRMGISERGQGSYLPVQSIHAIRVIRGSNRQAGESPPFAKSGSRGVHHTWPRPRSAAVPRSCPKPSRKGPACFGHQRGAVSSCDNGAAWTGTRRGGQISFGLTHGEHFFPGRQFRVLNLNPNLTLNPPFLFED